MSCVSLLQIPLQTPDGLGAVAADLASQLQSVDGALNTVWASQHEDDKFLGLATVWESYDAQKKFASSAEGSKLNEKIKSTASGDVYDDVVLFQEDVTGAIKANVVELVSWIHPVESLDTGREQKVYDDFTHFQQAILTKAPESDGGLVAGWAQTPFEFEGQKCRRFTSFIGWKSVEAHYDCKKTKPFLDNIHYLMQNNDVGVEMVHYPYSQSLGVRVKQDGKI